MKNSVTRRCEEQLRALDLPHDLPTVRDLADHLADRRGRPIELVAWQDPAFSAAWVASTHADYLFYEQATTPLHQEACICHELGHMICGHLPDTPTGSVDLPVPLRSGAAALMLGRSCRNDREQEYEAELVATMLLRSLTQTRSDAARRNEQPLEVALRRRRRR